jgi:hypothetical protein
MKFSTKNGKAISVTESERNGEGFKYIFSLKEKPDIRMMEP